MLPTSADADTPLLSRRLPASGDGELKFAAPWEARAFAIVVSLSQAGHFTWSEWVECFSREVALDAGVTSADGKPRSYYEQWLSAAESLLSAKGLMTAEQLHARRFAVAVAGTGNVRRWPAETR
ncbi:MAG: nitrile hydratase accessory protein [Chitinophagaceae bacterium]|nr:nitrile hydratase accessory protein [Rubrivivax sp.]